MSFARSATAPAWWKKLKHRIQEVPRIIKKPGSASINAGTFLFAGALKKRDNIRGCPPFREIDHATRKDARSAAFTLAASAGRPSAPGASSLRAKATPLA